VRACSAQKSLISSGFTAGGCYKRGRPYAWVRILRSIERVPFNRPQAVGAELEYVSDALARAELAAAGRFTRLCTDWLEERVEVEVALLVHSATAALEMMALLLELEPGDEVIMPSFTFSSSATAVALRGATPVFVDIRPDTLNLDETLTKE